MLAQHPAPLYADLLDLLQLIRVQEAGTIRIVVQNAEDAFAVSHRLPDLALIEGRAVVLDGMNLGQVIGEGYDPVVVQVGCTLLFYSLQVKEVLFSFNLLHEQEVFASVSRRDQRSFFREVAHIERWDVFGEAGKGRILPDHNPCPVGEVVVAEAMLHAHGGEHGRALLSLDLVLHQQRRSVSESLHVLSGRYSLTHLASAQER